MRLFLLFSCGPRVLFQAVVEGAGKGADRPPPQAHRPPQPIRGQDSLAQEWQPNDGTKVFQSLIGDSLINENNVWYCKLN